MSVTNNIKQISIDEVAGKFDSALKHVDEERLTGLGEVSRVSTLRNQMLNRERVTVVRDLGEDHPSVKIIDERLKVNTVLSTAINEERSRISISIPEADPEAWILYGVVEDSKRKGIPGVSVRLHSRRGGPIESLGSAKTEDNGFFLLRAILPETEQPSDEEIEREITVIENERTERFKLLEEQKLIRIREIDLGISADDEQGNIRRQRKIAKLELEMGVERNKINADIDKRIVLIRQRVISGISTTQNIFAHVVDTNGKELLADDEPLSPMRGEVDHLSLTVIEETE